jgi:uncharacterized protein YoxC
MFLEIGVFIISIVFLLLVVFSIPFLLQIWRSAKGITATLHMVNENLPGILKNLEEISTNINKATYTVNEQIEGLAVYTGRIQGILSIITDMDNFLRASMRLPIFKTIRNVAAVVTGVRVFLKVFLSSRESE